MSISLKTTEKPIDFNGSAANIGVKQTSNEPVNPFAVKLKSTGTRPADFDGTAANIEFKQAQSLAVPSVVLKKVGDPETQTKTFVSQTAPTVELKPIPI